MSETDNPYDPFQARELSAPSRRKKWTSPIVTTLVCVLIGFVLLGLLLPTMRRTGPASNRMMCSSNMRSLAVALMSYEKAYGQLPPAYTVNERGERMHSWRTLILPYLEEIALYSKIDLSVPWDHSNNTEARKTNPWVFRCPASKLKVGFTTYQVIVNDQSCFRPGMGRMLTEVTDGLTNTLLIVESDLNSAVHWMSPQDMVLDAFLSQESRSQSAHLGGYGGGHAVKADMAVIYLPQEVDKDFLRALVTVDGGERVESFDSY